MQAVIGDITNPKVDIVVNPANGVGVMGRGVAGAITEAGGASISEEAKRLVKERGKPFEAGDVYITGSGDLWRRGILKIYHAVTMQFPGGLTSVDIVNKLMIDVLELAIKNKINSIAFPGLGTGIGRLDQTTVANTMAQVCKRYDHKIGIKIIDVNKFFIKEIDNLIGFPL